MAKSKSFKKQKFSGLQMLLVALVFGVVGGVIGWAAFAAPHKGGGGNGGATGTISLTMVTDRNGDGLPNYNDVVTFAVSTSSTTQPYVTLKCSQNGTLVLQTSNGIFPISLNQNFTLASPAWTGGGADCTATLQNWDNYYKRGTKGIIDITSISFHVNA